MFEVVQISSQILIQLLSTLCVCKLMSFCALWDFRTFPHGVISHTVHGLARSALGLVPPCWSSHNSFLRLPSALNYSSFFQALSTSPPQPVSQMGKAVIPPSAARAGLACPRNCKCWSCGNSFRPKRPRLPAVGLRLRSVPRWKLPSRRGFAQRVAEQQSLPSVRINPPGEAALGVAICTSLQRQKCELSEEAARLRFLLGKPPGLFSTGQQGERDTHFANTYLLSSPKLFFWALMIWEVGLWVIQHFLPCSCRIGLHHWAGLKVGEVVGLGDKPHLSAFTP